MCDSAPDLVLDDVDVSASGAWPSSEPADEAPAIVVYTSGTTGPPKGVVLPRRALASNLDALADAWDWTGDDVVAHGLPLFHVHGLILGVLGPLRRGGGALHLGRFSSEAAGAALSGPATMLFGVPTMYHRLAADLESIASLASAVGSRPPARVRQRRAARRRPRADRGGVRAADRRALRDERDADEHGDPRRRRAPAGDGRAAAAGRRLPAGRRRRRRARRLRRRDRGRDPGARAEPLPRVPQPARRDGRGAARRLVRDRRRRDAFARRLHPDRRTPRDRPDQERRLQDRGGRDRERADRASRVAEAAVTGEPDDDLGERIVAWVVVEGLRRARICPSSPTTWRGC